MFFGAFFSPSRNGGFRSGPRAEGRRRKNGPRVRRKRGEETVADRQRQRWHGAVSRAIVSHASERGLGHIAISVVETDAYQYASFYVDYGYFSIIGIGSSFVFITFSVSGYCDIGNCGISTGCGYIVIGTFGIYGGRIGATGADRGIGSHL